MKRILCVILAIVVLGAGEEVRAAFQFGVKGGVAFSQIASSATGYQVQQGNAIERVLLNGRRSGASLGGYVSFDLIAFVDLQPEVLFVQRGGTGTYLGRDMTFDFNYVEVPLLVKLRLPLPTFGINAFAGPSLSFRQKGQIAFKDAEITSSPNVRNLKQRYWSGIAGLGLDLGFGPMVLGFEGRYSWALEDITSPDTKPLQPLEALFMGTKQPPRNEAITLMVSLGLKLGI